MSGSEKKLSFWELMIIGIGQLIGSGIMVLLCIAMGMTGKGVAFSFIVAAVIVIIPLIAMAALGSAIPNSGGMYVYVRDLIGKKTGFFYVTLLVFGQFILAQYAIGVGEYAKELWSNVNVGLISMGVMTFVFIVNLIGLKTSVLLQRFVVVILVGSLLVFVIYGFPQVKDVGSFFQASNILPNGLGSFVAVLYVLIAIVAAGVLPIDEVAFKTLGVVAKKILPTWMYFVFMIGGGMFALISSLNAVFAWATKGIKQAIKDGWLPEKLAEENKRFGTAHWLLLMYYLVGMYPILIGQEIKTISVIGTNIGLIFSGFPVVAIMFLAKKRPKEYENAQFKLPKWAMYTIPAISMCIYVIGVLSSWDYLKSQGAITPIIVFCIIVAAYTWIREPYVKNKQSLQKEE